MVLTKAQVTAFFLVNNAQSAKSCVRYAAQGVWTAGVRCTRGASIDNRRAQNTSELLCLAEISDLLGGD